MGATRIRNLAGGLVSGIDEVTPAEDPVVMWRTLAAFFLCGATIGVVSLLLPHPSQFDDRALWSNVILAYFGSIMCVGVARHLPAWCAQVALAVGTLLITRAVYDSHDPSGFYIFFYVWVGLYAFFFFGLARGFAYVAWVGVAYTLLLVDQHAAAPAGRLLMLVTTLAVGGIVVDGLMRRVRRTAAESTTRARNLAAVGDVAHRLARADPEGAGPAICKAATEVAGASAASLWEPDPEGKGLVATASVGATVDDAVVPFVAPRSGAIRAFSSAKPLFVGDAERSPDLDPQLVARTGAASCLFQPVLRDGEPVAVLVVVWSQLVARLDRELAEVVALLASEASIAIERAELFRRLEWAARTDDLTGLPNRRAWDEELVREIARAGREQTPMCVAVLDLDHFKEYNDRLGHQAGDLLLKEIAAAWQGKLRATDILARYGGEEFALALPGCPIAEGEELIERLRAATPMGETCSAGLVCWDREEPAQELVGRADVALYAAKAAGRDRVVAA